MENKINNQTKRYERKIKNNNHFKKNNDIKLNNSSKLAIVIALIFLCIVAIVGLVFVIVM